MLLTNFRQLRHEARLAFHNERGAIDLASIMVGVLVVGAIGGVIAASVFTVIPWAQDNAAKQQLDSIVSAQSAYIGLGSDPHGLPDGHPQGSYADSGLLETAGLLQRNDDKYCTVYTEDGRGYSAFSLSASGKLWHSTDKNTRPVEVSPSTLPDDCGSLRPADMEATLTKMTYQCDTTKTVQLLFYERTSEGTATWSDGTTQTLPEGSQVAEKELQAGVSYTLTYDGTYNRIGHPSMSWVEADCLRAVTHWGDKTGVTNATHAFYRSEITDVPNKIPKTITNASYMFADTPINDPDISEWDVSNIDNMGYMFWAADSFNQNLNNWNVSKVSNMSNMFARANKFNQPLNSWNVSNVTNMAHMFNSATTFNQPLNNWNVSNVTNMSFLFNGATKFEQSLENWNVGNVKDMSYMFAMAHDTKIDWPIGNWNVSNVENMRSMFSSKSNFNQPLNNWNVSNVTNMSEMFYNAKQFNQPLNNWNTSKVTDMSDMFAASWNFNRDISGWNVSNVKDMSGMFYDALAFNQPIGKWNVSNVTNMERMFNQVSAFNQPLNDWDVSNVTNMWGMFKDSGKFNQPLNKWNVSKVKDMSQMFYPQNSNVSFNHLITHF